MAAMVATNVATLVTPNLLRLLGAALLLGAARGNVLGRPKYVGAPFPEHAVHHAFPICGLDQEATNGEPMDCGCCNTPIGKAHCYGSDCICSEDSHPVQRVTEEVEKGPVKSFLNPKAATKALRGKSVLLIGDSTARRLFWGLCFFLKGRTFHDFVFTMRKDIHCWIPRTKSNKFPINIKFHWLPSSEEWASSDHTGGMSANWPDIKVVSIYHHDQANGVPMQTTLKRLAMGPNSTSSASTKPWASKKSQRHRKETVQHTLFLTPNLFGDLRGADLNNATKVNKRVAQNKDILKFVGALQKVPFEFEHVSVLDSTTWMLAGKNGTPRRHPCLTAGPKEIHINNHFGQMLRVQQLLVHLAELASGIDA